MATWCISILREGLHVFVDQIPHLQELPFDIFKLRLDMCKLMLLLAEVNLI